MSGYLSLADGRLLPVRDGVVMGRVAGCDLVIDDTKASRRHARFVVENGVVEIEDLDSSNGTMLNGSPVTRRVLRDGDKVQVGKTVITYHEGEPPGAPAGRGQAASDRPAQAAPKAFAVDDDNDLFGDGPAESPAAPASPAAFVRPTPPAAPTRPSAEVRPTPPPSPVPSPPPASPPLAPPRPAVVEFADEVVEVRKAPAAPKPSAPGPAAPTVSKAGRVLQFQKQSGGGGLLGDDLAQLSGGTRGLIYAVVLALAAAIVWGIVKLVR